MDVPESSGLLGSSISHGTLGGVMSVLNGGKFGHGFASSFLSKFITTKLDLKGDISGKEVGNAFSRTMIAGMIGGTVSAATGGKFANGPVTSAFQWAFNAESRNSSKIFGSGDIEKSINSIRGTEEGNRILTYLESDEHIMSVTLTTGGGDLGNTVIHTMSKIVGEKPSWWEFWKSPDRVDISIVQIKINMNVSDPSLIAVDGSSFIPTLTRIVAHELGHAYNFARHGSSNYRHNSIKIENTIMQQLDPSSTVRHPTLGHRGIGSQF